MNKYILVKFYILIKNRIINQIYLHLHHVLYIGQGHDSWCFPSDPVKSKINHHLTKYIENLNLLDFNEICL